LDCATACSKEACQHGAKLKVVAASTPDANRREAGPV